MYYFQNRGMMGKTTVCQNGVLSQKTLFHRDQKIIRIVPSLMFQAQLLITTKPDRKKHHTVDGSYMITILVLMKNIIMICRPCLFFNIKFHFYNVPVADTCTRYQYYFQFDNTL